MGEDDGFTNRTHHGSLLNTRHGAQLLRYLSPSPSLCKLRRGRLTSVESTYHRRFRPAL